MIELLNFKLPIISENITQQQLDPYQLDAWRSFLGISNLQIGELFKNPYRVDNNPGCKLYDCWGIIYMSDYPSYIWNRNTIYSAVMKKHQCSYYEALKLVKEVYLKDITIEISQESKIIYNQPKFQFELEFKHTSWTTNHLQYFESNVDFTFDDFVRENYYPIIQYWANSKKEPDTMFSFKNKDQAFGYMLPQYNTKKLKFPHRDKQYKWLSNVRHGQIGGQSEIKGYNLLIITKSMNDYLIFIKLGFNCRFLKDENETLTEDFIRFCNMFQKVLFIMDNDLAGLNAVNRLSLEWIVKVGNEKAVFSTLPEELNSKNIKDPFDFMKVYKEKEFKNEIDKIYESKTTKFENRFLVQQSSTFIC